MKIKTTSQKVNAPFSSFLKRSHWFRMRTVSHRGSRVAGCPPCGTQYRGSEGWVWKPNGHWRVHPASRNFILPEDEDEKGSCAETCAWDQPAFSRRNVGGGCQSGAMPEYVFLACSWRKGHYEQIILISLLVPTVCSSVLFRRKKMLLYLQTQKVFLPLESQRLLLK